MGDCIARQVKLISLPLLINNSGFPRIFARDTLNKTERKNERTNERMNIVAKAIKITENK